MEGLKDQVPFRSPVPAVPPPKEEGFIDKIMGVFTWWIGGLTGRSKSKKQAAKGQQPPPQAQQGQPPQPQQPVQQVSASPQPEVAEDSVTEDIQKFKKLVGNFSSKVNKSVGPVVSKGIQESSQKASAFGKSNQKFLRTVFKIFFIVVLLMVVGFVGMRLFGNIQNGNGKVTPTPEDGGITATPTPIVYNPTKPSIYAQDPVVLKLEQDVDVLVREISGTNIRETQLNPPTLDFGISF